MQFTSLTLGLSGLLALAQASPVTLRSSNGSGVGPYGLHNAHCEHHFYEVPVASNNTKFVDVEQVYKNQSYVTAQILSYITGQSNWTMAHQNGTQPYYGSFNISGYLCTPIKGAKKDSALQLLVHGIGFDSSYWDFTLSPDYSYVRHAASHGYTTFRYDRLGTGASETPDNGFDVSQAATEISILTNINKMLRNSTEIGGKKWNKIVGIGHSYGSVQTQAVSAATPELYDAVILQGFSANATFLPRYLEAAAYSIARDVLPDHLSNKPTTWLATGSIASDQQGFFYFPYYSQASFDLARKTEQPVTLGSLFTVGVSAMPAPGFSKPVQVVTGAKDFIFTGSNAYAGANGMSIPAEVGPMLYPNSKGFETYIPANTGHAVNQHYSAAATYEKMLDFISRNNL